MPDLTPKQRRFVDEYLIDLNATQAYIRAGYSAQGAEASASRLLANAKIAEVVAERQGQRAERVELTQDWVLERLRENTERAMQAVPVLDSEGHETGEWRYEGSVANRSVELIGKHLGMFITEKHEHRFPELPPQEAAGRIAAILNSARARKAAANGNGKH